jgi:hypothetical protein
MDLENHYTEFNVLYKLSKTPYSPKKSWTTEREFIKSYVLENKPKFVLEQLKQIKTA